MGRGIGSMDTHLLASAKLSHSQLWIQDRRRQADLALEQRLAVPEAQEASQAKHGPTWRQNVVGRAGGGAVPRQWS
jgi:hypothetical protein